MSQAYEPGDEEILDTESELSPTWGFARAVFRVVMWVSATALIVAASVDGILNDHYARAAFELALVVVWLLFEILEAVAKR